MQDLARIHRPRTFSEMAGQATAKALLQRRLEGGEPPAALMLQGPPGTGKTTTARIIAAGLNCTKGPTSEPCGECRSCKAILAGRSEWVFELNAGANGGIDTLREVIEELRRPVPSTAWRVLILDECQAMTQAAQTALLKPLEEPPTRTVMVLATTHPQGIQQAIRSRCEPISFKALPPAEIESLLAGVIEAEELEISAEAMAAIVSRADGSPRNALKLLALAAEHPDTFEMHGQKQIELLAARVLRRAAEGDLPQALEAGTMLTRACVTEHGDGAVALQALGEMIYSAISVQQLSLQADELNLGEEAWVALRRAAENTTLERLGAWTDLVWEAWGRSKSALLRMEALMGLVITRMHKATGESPAPAPAAVQSKRETPTVAPAQSGPLDQDAMVTAAAGSPNVQSLLKKAEFRGLEGGLLTLGSSSLMTRRRLSSVAGEVVEILAGQGVREVEVVQ